jgi:Fe-S-cluster containining protein
MTEKKYFLPADFTRRKELLQTIYGVYADWMRRFPLACRKGCDACCTQSVTMTSLEGEVILDRIRRQGREEWLLKKLAQATPGTNRPSMTTNQFAEACLKQIDVENSNHSNWDFSPCIFLKDASCLIYEERPFGCRSFGSLVQCRSEGSAEMAPIHLTVNTVLTQIIEHLNSENGYWSGMTDILHSLVGQKTIPPKKHLLRARPIPGLLLEPQEVMIVRSILKRLAGHSSASDLFGDLIDNFRLI